MENKKIKILVIDDNADNLISLRALIGDTFPEVVVLTAINGIEGIQLAKTDSPDVILLDVVMPIMDGFEVCRKLKSDSNLREIPVVFVTALKGDKESRIRALECGGEAFLTKPIDESELTAQIRAMVKIRKANLDKDNEKSRLALLVAERTGQLQAELWERKRAEKEILKISQHYQTIIEKATDGIVLLTKEGKMTYISPSAKKIFGYNLTNEIIGHPADLTHPDDLEMVLSNLAKLIENPSYCPTLQYRFIDRKGNWKWVESTFSNLLADPNVGSIVINFREITERKQAEKELKEADALNKSLLQTIPFGMDIVDENGDILFQNEIFQQILGKSTIGSKCWEVYCDSKQQCTACPLKNGIEIGTTKILEVSGVLGGKVFEIIHTGMIFNGKKAMLEIFQDITERKKAEHELKESEERYRRFISQVTEGVYRLECTPPMDLSLPLEVQVDYVYDNLLIAECNDSFMKMYGYNDRKDVIGKGHLNFHGGRNNPTNRELIRQLIKNEFRISGGITEELNAFGQPIIISNNSIGILENNKLSRIWGTQIDITEKVKADQLQQVLFTISNAAVTTNDLSELIEIISYQLRILLRSNNFFIAFYDENTGMLSTQQGKDEKDEISAWPAEKSLTGYVIKHRQSLLVNEDGKERLYESGEINRIGTASKIWLGVPMIVHGKAIGAIVVQSYNDPEAFNEKDKMMLEFISSQIGIAIERKKAEQELKEALVKAQESDRLKSAFLANMSHEIRTPMNGILGFAELLKEPDLTGEDQQEYVEIIQKSGTRMLNIINDIIDISKIEAGLMEIRNTATDINDQIKYIYTFFKPEVEAKGINLLMKTSLKQEDAIIITDREKLYAILINLVKNAIKYSHQGTIEFGYNLRQLTENKNIKELEFYVKDAGIGIPADRQEAIFERFVQADIADKQAYQGAGLGLAITKAYVMMLGGSIWVESDTGETSQITGSVFYFTIPYHNYSTLKIDKSAKHVGKTEKKLQKKLKILIVEDEETSDKLFTISFNQYSREILHAKTGLDAIETCRNNPDIDLIMMDIKMPVMDGYKATEQIRKFNKEVVIIAQTAYALMGDRNKALLAGCNDYITKPINKALLLNLVQKYFSN
jgi:PAS domain S-box-containing protein